ncbi:LPXTG cell wall anchor domain-containing protein [Streptomyces sp. NPDC001348]
MKLRRAMAAAAATAAIAPIALLSAPAAFAEESTSSAPTESVTTTDTPTDTPTDTASQTGTPTDTPTDTVTPTDTTTDTTSPADTVTPTDTTSAAGTTKPTVAAAPTDTTGSPSEWPSECPVGDDGVDPDSQLSLDVSGLPGKIVAGSGWHYFSLTAANHSDVALGEVQWLAAVDNASESDNEKDWLSAYARLEYFDPATKAWESLADEIGNGYFFGQTDLGAKETVAIKLRVDISSKAPAGGGYALGLGGYVDPEKECVHSSFAYYGFTVLAPGSDNDDPGKAEPKPGDDDKPAGGKEPQGGAKELPPTGSLASTGSSSALPVIGVVGGVAVVAGAGVVFAVRRRKASAGA